MQSMSLLRGLGADFTTMIAADQPQVFIQTAPSTSTPTGGQCSADGQFVWIAATTTVPGHWERLRAGQTCQSFTPSGTGPTTTDHRGDDGASQGGVIVRDESGNVVDTTVQIAPPPTDITVFDAKVQSGAGQFVVVGAFKFPAEVERAAFTIWGGRKLSPEWQAALDQAMKYPTGSPVAMPPGLAWYLDAPPATFNERFFGLVADGRPPKQPGWAPIARVKHPINGKDYGVFVGISVRYPSGVPMNDSRQGPFILHFIWAPIDKAWYEDVWDWIVELVASVVNFVCDKITDPAAAATVGVAATAGGPVTVGVATGAALLCQKPSTPAQDQLPPAIEQKPTMWPYYLAGGVAVLGLVAFLLIPPKKRPA